MSRRPNGLEPGVYFRQLQLPEQAEFLTHCVAAGWADAGEERPWEEQILLEEARQRPTLVGFLQEEPVGVVQFHPEKEAEDGYGWISLYCVEVPYRRRGYGIQLLGQAVAYYRPLGRRKLRLALSGGNGTARQYFADYGFVPAGKTAAGREILEKNIGYETEFLGETGTGADFPQVCR